MSIERRQRMIAIAAEINKSPQQKEREKIKADKWRELSAFWSGQSVPLSLDRFIGMMAHSDAQESIKNQHRFFCNCTDCQREYGADYTVVKRFECPACRTSVYKQRNIKLHPEMPVILTRPPVFQEGEYFFCNDCKRYLSPQALRGWKRLTPTKDILTIIILNQKINRYEGQN